VTEGNERRITDLSTIAPEDFKQRNSAFLIGDAHYDVLSHQTREDLREQIWRVRNGDLRRVIEDFPRDVPLVAQCALWMHALVGRHFFPDANHRTAIATLRRLLRENGIDTGEWPVVKTKVAREQSHLEAAGESVKEVTSWIASADETPLTDLDFDALCRRHETLADHRACCVNLADERQQFLRKTTGRAEAGIAHRQLLPLLYDDFGVDHPVLATVASLEETCTECQRTVRRHLTRRG